MLGWRGSQRLAWRYLADLGPQRMAAEVHVSLEFVARVQGILAKYPSDRRK